MQLFLDQQYLVGPYVDGTTSLDNPEQDVALVCRVIAGVKARAEADPAFLFKLGCECGLDLAIIMIVNLACRRDKFLKELDFVLSQVHTLVTAGPPSTSDAVLIIQQCHL